eukprot:TRINITY_DN6432_c1_g4_i1.p1 TRINITY_DN6432_c1_g4~~TRINITY_DN6432_c1_g4_i1.p1  ORF type:complete len:1002 (+),score=251.53 TRINITY_DN6432_c1_g4_i1:174-3179(+)
MYAEAEEDSAAHGSIKSLLLDDSDHSGQSVASHTSGRALNVANNCGLREQQTGKLRAIDSDTRLRRMEARLETMDNMLQLLVRQVTKPQQRGSFPESPAHSPVLDHTDEKASRASDVSACDLPGGRKWSAASGLWGRAPGGRPKMAGMHDGTDASPRRSVVSTRSNTGGGPHKSVWGTTADYGRDRRNSLPRMMSPGSHQVAERDPSVPNTPGTPTTPASANGVSPFVSSTSVPVPTPTQLPPVPPSPPPPAGRLAVRFSPKPDGMEAEDYCYEEADDDAGAGDLACRRVESPHPGGGVAPEQVRQPEQRRLAYTPSKYAAEPTNNYILLPEDVRIQALEIAVFLTIVCEALLATYRAALYSFDEFPAAWELTFLSYATVLYIVFIFMQFRIARLIGWRLIDDDATIIAEQYKSFWLRFDVPFGAVPWDLLILPVSVTAYRIACCIRIFKLSRTPTFFRPSNPLYDRRNMPLIFLAWGFFIHHFIACIHMLIKRRHDEFADYIESLYWSIQTTTSVGYGDIITTSTELQAFSILCMIMGSTMYAWFLGNMNVYFMSHDQIERKQKETRMLCLSVMRRYNVPLKVQKEAFAIYPLIWGDDADHNLSEVLDFFPPYLQMKIWVHVKLNLIRQVPMFREAEEFILEELAIKLTRLVLDPDQLVIRMHEVGKEMFFISSGAVEVLVPNESGEFTQIVLLGDGSWFGEIAILKETRRTAAIRTVTLCDLFMLKKEDFISIFEMYPNSRFEQSILAEVERRVQILKEQEAVPAAQGRAAVYETSSQAASSAAHDDADDARSPPYPKTSSSFIKAKRTTPGRGHDALDHCTTFELDAMSADSLGSDDEDEPKRDVSQKEDSDTQNRKHLLRRFIGLAGKARPGIREPSRDDLGGGALGTTSPEEAMLDPPVDPGHKAACSAAARLLGLNKARLTERSETELLATSPIKRAGSYNAGPRTARRASALSRGSYHSQAGLESPRFAVGSPASVSLSPATHEIPSPRLKNAL